MQVFDPIEDTHALHQIEAALARLMPTALSQGAQLDIEEMIDELAGPESKKVVKLISKLGTKYWQIGGGIAAAIAALCALFPIANRSSGLNDIAVSAPKQVLLSKSDCVKASTNEGRRESSDGSVVQEFGVDNVSVSSMLDIPSGMEIHFNEMSCATLIVPVSRY
jgi:hypothetical protein